MNGWALLRSVGALSVAVRLLPVLLMALLPLGLEGAPPQEAVDRPGVVDLTTLQWRVRAGFQPGDERSPPPVGHKVRTFPLSGPRSLGPPADGTAPEYTFWTSFRLAGLVPRDPGLFLIGLGNHFQVFVNGHQVRSDFFRDASGRLVGQRTRMGVYAPLRAGWLQQGNNLLVIRVAARRPTFPGMSTAVPGLFYGKGYEFGSMQILRERHSEVMGLSLLPAYLLFGLYHLLLFARRRELRYNLYFACFTIGLFVYFATRSHMAYSLVVDTAWLTRLENASLFMLAPLFYSFLEAFFGLRWRGANMVAGLLFGVGGVLAVAALVAPFDYIVLLVEGWNWTIRPAIVLAAPVVMGRALYFRHPDRYVLLAGVGLFFATVLWDILNTLMGLVSMNPLFRYGFFGFVVFLGALLANRFAKLYRQKEELNRGLDRTNAHLRNVNAAQERFIPREFLQFLGRSNIVEAELGDQTRSRMAIMFADIHGYTSLSEHMSPEDNFAFLNGYLARVAPVIRERGGFVHQYYGDGIMALFPSGPEGAVSAAGEMLATVENYNHERGLRERSELRISVGMHYGDVMIGILGEANRVSPGVVSDAVNLTARLEELTRLFDADMLVSGELLSALGDAAPRHRVIGPARVRGRERTVEVIELLAGSRYEQARMETAQLFVDGVAAVRRADWPTARSAFAAVMAKDATDRAAAVYLEKIASISTVAADSALVF